MVQTPVKPTTLAAFLKQPETAPACEFIDGKITQKPMPKGKHSRLQTKLPNVFNEVLEAEGTGLAFSELRCTFGGASIVPDIVVLRSDLIPKAEDGDIADAVKVAPSATIEILSPQQSSIKVIKNIDHSLQHGTELGWLIDPKEKTVLILRPDIAPQVVDKPDAQLPTPQVLGKFNLTVSTLFSWLKV